MKKYLRQFVVNAIAIHLASIYLPALQYQPNLSILLQAALALTLINLFVKPLLKFLLLPINLITMGAFRWLVNVFALYLVTLIIANFNVVGFEFAGTNFGGIVIPALSISTFWSFVIVSLLISFLTTAMLWLAK